MAPKDGSTLRAVSDAERAEAPPRIEGRRSERFDWRVTGSERLLLEANAKKLGVSVSQFLRAKVFGDGGGYGSGAAPGFGGAAAAVLLRAETQLREATSRGRRRLFREAEEKLVADLCAQLRAIGVNLNQAVYHQNLAAKGLQRAREDAAPSLPGLVDRIAGLVRRLDAVLGDPLARQGIGEDEAASAAEPGRS